MCFKATRIMLARQQTGRSTNSGPSHRITDKIIAATNNEAIYKNFILFYEFCIL
jgi:hypothetical protein